MECWGKNYYSKAEILDATQAYRDVAVAKDGTCGLTNDTLRIHCWGRQYGSWPGFGSQSSFSGGNYWLQTSDTAYSQIVAGSFHLCALRFDNGVDCFGGNSGSGGHLSDPSTGVSSDGYSQLTAGYAHTCGLKITDSTAHCWGNNDEGQLSAPSGISLVYISAGFKHTCALSATGLATCWGRNTNGQLDVDSSEVYLTISAGISTTCAVKAVDGLVTCVGDGSDGMSTAQTTPVCAAVPS